MIRFFRKYQKTVFGILIFLTAALLLTSFGVDYGSQSGGRYSDRPAVQIDDIKITREEFQQKKRAVEENYRAKFGPQYRQILQQFGLNISQSILDELVNTTLLLKHARDKKFAAADSEVIAVIKQQFPNGVDSQALLARGISDDQIMHDVEQQVLLEQIDTLLRQASIPSPQEFKKSYEDAETTYDLEYTAFEPLNFESGVVTPSQEILSAYFEKHKDEFQTQPQVSFSFVSFDPEKFFSAVEVPQEEIDFYYTENSKLFEVPESLKVRHIQLLFPKEDDPKKLAEVRERAQEILGKAKAGDDFASLALKNSDDMTSRLQGGELGWVPRGRYSKNFDEKTFAVKNGGIADLVENDFGFQIVKVEQYREAYTKPIEEVRETIIKKLKNEQAPAIADAAAREFFDGFRSAEVSLEEYAKQKGMTVTKQTEPLDESKEAPGAPVGFTKKIMADLPEAKQFVEDKKTSFVVEVLDQKESTIPPLDSVKDAVLTKYRKENGVTLAKDAAESVLKEVQQGKDLEVSAKEKNGTIQKAIDLKKGQGKPPLFNAEFEATLLSGVEAALPTKPSAVLSANGNFYLGRVIKRSVPDIGKAKPEELEKIREEIVSDNARTLRSTLIETLKRQSTIEIDQSVLLAG